MHIEPLMQFLLALVVIITAAKSSGYLSSRLGQPAVLGEILAGLILGPTVLNMLHWPIFSSPHVSESIGFLAQMGVLFLMFIAGLEVDFSSMLKAGRPAFFAGTLGVIVPMGFGAFLALLFGHTNQQMFFIGLLLAPTSVSISAQTLMDLGILRSRMGIALLSAAIVDDTLVILILSLLVALAAEAAGVGAVAIILLKMAAFLGVAGLFGIYIIPKLLPRIERLPISEGVIASVIVITLLYAWGAEVLGSMAAITGAFLAGMMFGRTPFRQQIESGLHTIAYSWLVPIFFVSIGLEANARHLGLKGIPFALLLILAAVLSKVIGSGGGVWLGGFTKRESLGVGVGMAARGEVVLIVAAVGLNMGMIKDELFASVVLMVLATTLLTPILLKWIFSSPTSRPEPVQTVEL